MTLEAVRITAGREIGLRRQDRIAAPDARIKELMMLVISRKEKQSVQIDEKTTVTVNAIKGNTVTLGFEAPRDVRIVRGELLTSNEHAKEWERK